MTPQPAKAEVMSEIYELLRHAAVRRQPVAAFYDGLPRLLCPHVLGRKSGRLHALFYQLGGSSHSGLPLAPEGVGRLALLGRGETQPSRVVCRGMAYRATLPAADLP